MNLDNFTLVFFIESLIQETLLTLNPLFISDLKIILLYPENYQPVLLFNKPEITVKCNNFKQIVPEIINFIDTEWLFCLKPEEVLTTNISTLKDLKFPVYSVNIEIPLISGTILSSDESRIFRKSFQDNKNNSEESLPFTVTNYSDGFPELETAKYKKYIELYQQGNSELDTIVYLFHKGFLKESLNKLLEIAGTFKNKKAWSKNLLQLYIEIAEAFSRDSNLLKAKSVLLEIIEHYINSPTVNYLLGEIHFKLEENITAEVFFDTCINLISNNNYYKSLIIDKSKLISMSNFYLGQIYLKSENFDKAKNLLKISLEININSKEFKKAYELANNKLKESKNYINELDFSCQGCGNSCTTYDIEITNKDIERILDNRQDLKPTDFIDIYDGIISNIYKPFIDSDGKKKRLILKHKEGGKECIFFKNSLCTIHDFKPLVCKVFPFTINSVDNSVIWANYTKEFIRELCAYKLVKNANDPENLHKLSKKCTEEIREYNNLVIQWNYNIENDIQSRKDKIESPHIYGNFLDFFININTYKKEFAENIVEFLNKDDRILLIITNPFPALHFIHNNSLNLALYIDSYKMDSFLLEENIRNLELKFKAKISSFETLKTYKLFTFYSEYALLNLYIYSSESLNNPIFFYSKILVDRNLYELKYASYHDLLKLELLELYKQYNKSLAEAADYLKNSDFNSSNKLLKSIVSNYLFYLIYLIKGCKLTFFELVFSEISTDDFKNFILSITLFDLNLKNQSYFINKLDKNFQNLWEFAKNKFLLEKINK